MFPQRPATAAAAILILLGGAPAAAQPAGGTASPYAVALEGPSPTAGLGVPIRVRIQAAPGVALTGGGGVTEVRVVRPRLLSPAGAALPVTPPPPGSAQAGVYPFRGDLPVAGVWTLSFTLLRPGARAAAVSLGFPVAATAARPPPAEAAPPAVAAPDAGFQPAQPAVVPPGPSAPRAGPS